jgi:flavin-dependent dehydrogenase
MQQYDVIIIGGGPAGLKCALEISRSDMSILLLEKADDFGNKLCAGGLTMKDIPLLSLPDHLIQQNIVEATISTRGRAIHTRRKVPFLYTVNRSEMGRWQIELLEDSNVEIRTGSRVVEIDRGTIKLRSGEVIGYQYLVGADGYASIVRRYLGLKVRKKLMGYQYTLSAPDVKPEIELFLDARRFGAWYAWIFPHRNSIAVGCCFDPGKINHMRVRTRFMDWLREKNIDPGEAVLQSYPIGCDYRGYRFGNIFLAGEAAGLASWFTGEGIYQSLVSGQEIARLIMDPGYEPDELTKVLKYNRLLERIMFPFLLAGPLKGSLQELSVFLMTRKKVRDLVNSAYM